jgi:hypothetical protein
VSLSSTWSHVASQHKWQKEMADVCHVAANLSTRQDDGQTNLTFLLSYDSRGTDELNTFCQCDGQAFVEFTSTRLPANGC